MGIRVLAKGQRGGSGQQTLVTGMRRGNSHSTAVDCVRDCLASGTFVVLTFSAWVLLPPVH